MADDWDLYAVVRGCCSASASASSSTATTQPPENPFLYFPDPLHPRTSQSNEELLDLFKPMFIPSKLLQPLSPQTAPFSPLSVLGSLQDLSPPPQQDKVEQKQLISGSRAFVGASTSAATNPASSRSKRRKNQMKRVCQVPAEGLSSDMWSWRKYGQKPIKGSPHPRGYYRCSTSKGCLARKQVERSRSDPGTFIITYTGDHNHPMPTHRNSLAGSTRQKSVTSPTATAGEATKTPSSPPLSPAIPSPSTGKVERREEREDDEDDELGISDVAMEDDFFEGLEEIAGEVAGHCLSSHFPVGWPFPWLEQCNSATTTTAEGC